MNAIRLWYELKGITFDFCTWIYFSPVHAIRLKMVLLKWPRHISLGVKTHAELIFAKSRV